jgi:shikimate dehydrogenase
MTRDMPGSATRTKLAGVIGWPVSHSLSPRMHAFWLREHGIDGTYVALPVQRHDLSAALEGLRKAGFAGVNVTGPHKEAAFALAHTADDPSRTAQAANLLLIRKSRIEAFNTDIEGLTQSLRETLGKTGAGIRRAIVLGAGGAARAAVLACDGLGAREIYVLNRTQLRADILVRALCAAVRAKLTAAEWSVWETVARGTQLLINATSAGLNATPSPAIAVELLPHAAVVCDLVYNPLETPLLARARAHGLTAIDGLGMLMHQGALSFELLFGARPAVSAALRCDLERALRDGV